MTESPASSSVQTRLTTTFPKTSTLTREDLSALLGDVSYQSQQSGTNIAEQRAQDESFFEAFFHSLPQVQQLYEQHLALLKANEIKANANLELQKPLEDLRSETQSLFDRAKALEAEWPRLEAQMKEESKRFTPSSLLFYLTQSASKLNDRSEDLANAFVENLPYPVDDSGTASQATMDDVAFARRYKTQRMLYHKRKLIADRWNKGQVHWTD